MLIQSYFCEYLKKTILFLYWVSKIYMETEYMYIYSGMSLRFLDRNKIFTILTDDAVSRLASL